MGAIVGPTVGPTLRRLADRQFVVELRLFHQHRAGHHRRNDHPATRLRNPNEPRKLPLDVVGLALLALGLGSLQYVLDEGQRNDWFDSQVIVFFTLTAVVGIVAFIVWEMWGTKRPIVDLRAFKYRSVAAGAALGFAIGASLFGAIVLLPQYVQGLLNYTATLSGELILVRAIFIAALTPFIARIAGSGRFDTRILLTFGFLLVAASQFLQAGVTTTDTSFGSFVPSLIVGGVGLACLFVPISIAVLSSVPMDVGPKASAFQSLSLQIGGSFSTAGLVTLLAQRNAYHQSILSSTTTTAHPAIAEFFQAHGSIGELTSLVVQQASALSFADASLALAWTTLVLTPLVFILAKPRKLAPGTAIAVE